jgi:hypothetical protein
VQKHRILHCEELKIPLEDFFLSLFEASDIGQGEIRRLEILPQKVAASFPGPMKITWRIFYNGELAQNNIFQQLTFRPLITFFFSDDRNSVVSEYSILSSQI